MGSTFSGAEICFLPEDLFDHCPVVVRFAQNVVDVKRPFRYFNMLGSLPDFMEKVKTNWNSHLSGSCMFRGKAQALESCK